jgi:hypothetical protein
MDMNQVISGVKLTKACSIKPDKDSTDSKIVNLEVEFDGNTLMSVFQKALAQTVIQWQNGPGRSKFDHWTPNQTVKVKFKAPAAAPQLSPIEQMKVDAIKAGVDVEDKDAFKAFILKQLG